MSALDLIAKAAKKAKKSGPFFSKADVILDELQRGKGTGDEFLTELMKKGVKPTELKDRGLDKALKGKPKMTKAEVQTVFEQKAPPRVRDEIRGGYEYRRALDEKAQEMIGDEDVGFDDLYGRDKERAQWAVESDFGYNPETKYGEYATPGGENYREILLKLPKRGLNQIEQRNLMLYEGDIRRGKELDPWHQKQYSALKEKEAAGSQDYQSVHFKDTPNVLAHIRVQDFTTPEGKKVLLVDEIQSDWHQAGRKQGYIDPSKKPYTIEEEDGIYRVRDLNGQLFEPYLDGQRQYGFMTAQAAENAMAGNLGRLPMTRGVPDAPFKKNWHELAMKRVLDYAVENGYDTVAITPGAEQAKRYDLSKQIDALEWDERTGRLYAKQKNSGDFNKMADGVTPENLADYVGKEAAEKLIAQPYAGSYKQLSGVDLQVGGEGMKGFYDKILPDYLNNYGKKYGAQMGEIQLKTGEEMSRGPTGSDMVPTYSPTMQSFHSFNITPQMRQEINTKGQPMYGKVAMPALEGVAGGAGAAAVGSQMFDEGNEQEGNGMVKFLENPDAMRMELDNKEIGVKQYNMGGAVVSDQDLGAPSPQNSASPVASFQVGGIVRGGAKAGKTAKTAKTAEAAYAPGVHYADPLKPPTMPLSEALGISGSEGKTLNFTEADRSRVFGENMGGVGFAGLQHYSEPHKKAKVSWGFGNEKIAQRKTKQGDPEKTVWTTYIGSPDQHKSNTIVVKDALKTIQAANQSNLVHPEQIKLINQRLQEATNKKGNPLFPANFDITDPAALNFATTFERRAAISDALMGLGVKKPMISKEFKEAYPGVKWTDAGNVEGILRRETEPSLVGLENYSVGPHLFTMEGDVVLRPDLNIAFPAQTVGTDYGLRYKPTSIRKAAPDWIKEKGYGPEDVVNPRALSMGSPSQFVSEKYLTDLQKSGNKKGGAVKAKKTYKDGGAISALMKHAEIGGLPARMNKQRM
jgi:hypothetical protein